MAKKRWYAKYYEYKVCENVKNIGMIEFIITFKAENDLDAEAIAAEIGKQHQMLLLDERN